MIFFAEQDSKPEKASILAEMADCYALCGEEKTSKVLFREAFFINPETIDLDFLESELIECLVKKTKEKSEVNVIKIEKAVITTEVIPLKVLSEKIGITAAEITKRLFKEGIMKGINDSIDRNGLFGLCIASCYFNSTVL